MKRNELCLLMMALANGNPYTPVQVQKALFLATENLPSLLGKSPKYTFVPYDYGPFDKQVYQDLRVRPKKS